MNLVFSLSKNHALKKIVEGESASGKETDKKDTVEDDETDSQWLDLYKSNKAAA